MSQELYDLRVDQTEQRSLIRPAEGYLGWPRFARLVTTGEVQGIARDLESKLDRWIEETRAAGQGE